MAINCCKWDWTGCGFAAVVWMQIWCGVIHWTVLLVSFIPTQVSNSVAAARFPWSLGGVWIKGLGIVGVVSLIYRC